MTLTGGPATLTARADGTITIAGETRAAADIAGIVITGSDADDSLTLDLQAPLTIPVSFDGGAGNDTIVGPVSDVTWDVTGPDAGTVAGVDFTSVENLSGASDNKDTFVVAPGGSVSGKVDGGQGGFDTLRLSGTTVVSNPTDAHSGSITLDGHPIAYSGLEPVDISATDVVFNGADLRAGAPRSRDKDLIKVGPGASGSVQILDRDPTDTTDLAEAHSFTISGTNSLTINGGLGTDTVEFTGDYLVPNSSLTVNAEHIKVDSGVTINVGTGDIKFNAVYKDNGISLLGITTTIPVLGVDGLVDIDGATITGKTVSPDGLRRHPEHDRAHRADPDRLWRHAQGRLGGRLRRHRQLLARHLRDPDDLHLHRQGHRFHEPHRLQVHRSQWLQRIGPRRRGDQEGPHRERQRHRHQPRRARPRVPRQRQRPWRHAHHRDRQRHARQHDRRHGDREGGGRARQGRLGVGHRVCQGRRRQGLRMASATPRPRTSWPGPATTSIRHPTTASSIPGPRRSRRTPRSRRRSSWRYGKSQLSGTSSITTSTGDVAITSNVKTNVATTADASAAGLGAGIAVAVFVTDSEAYIDSTAATPVTAKNLTVSADTDNAAPTKGTASPKGDESTRERHLGQQPDGQRHGRDPQRKQTAAAGGKADNQSKTADGSQNNSAALAVVVLIATTQAYISPADGSSAHTIDTTGGTQKIHAGAKNVATATADAGNVKFSPDAPTLTPSTSGGSLADGDVLLQGHRDLRHRREPPERRGQGRRHRRQRERQGLPQLDRASTARRATRSTAAARPATRSCSRRSPAAGR